MTLHALGTSTSSIAFLLSFFVIDLGPRVATSLGYEGSISRDSQSWVVDDHKPYCGDAVFGGGEY